MSVMLRTVRKGTARPSRIQNLVVRAAIPRPKSPRKARNGPGDAFRAVPTIRFLSTPRRKDAGSAAATIRDAAQAAQERPRDARPMEARPWEKRRLGFTTASLAEPRACAE